MIKLQGSCITMSWATIPDFGDLKNVKFCFPPKASKWHNLGVRPENLSFNKVSKEFQCPKSRENWLPKDCLQGYIPRALVKDCKSLSNCIGLLSPISFCLGPCSACTVLNKCWNPDVSVLCHHQASESCNGMTREEEQWSEEEVIVHMRFKH